VDTLLRVEGGDESLINRIKADRKFQEYLQLHDPEHPLRSCPGILSSAVRICRVEVLSMLHPRYEEDGMELRAQTLSFHVDAERMHTAWKTQR